MKTNFLPTKTETKQILLSPFIEVLKVFYPICCDIRMQTDNLLYLYSIMYIMHNR